MVPATRSNTTVINPTATNEVAVRLIIAAEKIPHTKIGSRPQVIPGARKVITVAMKFKPPRIEEIPKVIKARRNRRVPVALVTDRGG